MTQPKVAPIQGNSSCRFSLDAFQLLETVTDHQVDFYKLPFPTRADRKKLKFFGGRPNKEVAHFFRKIELPCQSCMQCRLQYARDWSARIMVEAKLCERNSFITLTYNEDNVPHNGQLVKRDFQLFMKRLRAKHSGHQSIYGLKSPKGKHPIRFVAGAEYGDQFGRPHFHAGLINFKPYDLEYHSYTNTNTDTDT